MAGVRSIPTACRTTRANAQASNPGPQATSSEVSSAPASAILTIRSSASWLRMACAWAKGTAWRVNWSRMRERWSMSVMLNVLFKKLRATEWLSGLPAVNIAKTAKIAKYRRDCCWTLTLGNLWQFWHFWQYQGKAVSFHAAEHPLE